MVFMVNSLLHQSQLPSMKRFLAGLITGLVTSLLIVPGSGKANRAQLKATSREQGNQLKAEYLKIASDVKRLIDAAKKGAGLFRG